MSKQILLKNVRLSFPALFKKYEFQGVEQKYSATFLLPKSDVETKTKIDNLIKNLLTENKVKIGADKICIVDGDDKEYDGYAGNWSIKASNSKRPTVINRDKSPISEEDGVVYAGCYVNAIIEFWVQNNSFGKRVNANLLGVQFLKDGESFGSGDINVSDSFDVIADDTLPAGEDLAF